MKSAESTGSRRKKTAGPHRRTTGLASPLGAVAAARTTEGVRFFGAAERQVSVRIFQGRPEFPFRLHGFRTRFGHQHQRTAFVTERLAQLVRETFFILLGK